jgi:hypothetical protein
MRQYRDVVHALSISDLHGNADMHARSFLFVPRFAYCRCFALKENRRICLRYRSRVSVEIITRSKRHTHFLSESVGQVLESRRLRSMLTRTIYLTSGNITTMARPRNRNRPPNARLISLRSKHQRRAQRQAREGHQASRWTLPVPDVRHRRDHQ